MGHIRLAASLPPCIQANPVQANPCLRQCCTAALVCSLARPHLLYTAVAFNSALPSAARHSSRSSNLTITHRNPEVMNRQYFATLSGGALPHLLYTAAAFSSAFPSAARHSSRSSHLTVLQTCAHNHTRSSTAVCTLAAPPVDGSSLQLSLAQCCEAILQVIILDHRNTPNPVAAKHQKIAILLVEPCLTSCTPPWPSAQPCLVLRGTPPGHRT